MNNTITFPKPGDYLTLNSRSHWAVKMRRTGAWRRAAAAAATQLGNSPSRRRRPPSFVRITFPVTVDRRRDTHNWHATCKPIIDGLVDSGVWADDTDNYVIVLDPRFAKGVDVVTVELSPRAEQPGT